MRGGPPRILYVDLDSTRKDHFGAYGYPRATTPCMDAVAAEGVRFDNCYVSDSPCLPSRTALFTGMFGARTGVVNHGGRMADPRGEGPRRGFQRNSTRTSLAAALRRSGLYTCSISPFAHRHSAYHVVEGFHEFHDTGEAGYEPADVVQQAADDWLREHGRAEGWFLHVNFWDAHGPYDTAADYGNPFAADPPPGWLTQEIIERQRRSYGPNDAVTPRGIAGAVEDWPRGWPRGPMTIASIDDWKQWIDAYDTGLRYADDHIGMLVERLRQLGVYDNTVVIISADHGENHGELEVYGDHQTADQQTHNVPLIVRWPGVTDGVAGTSAPGLTYQLDLGSTLVDVLGGEVPAEWDGTSFAAALRGASAGREHLVMSHCAWSCQRSVRWDDYLLIRTYHTGLKNFPAVMLYDVRRDPHEVDDLVVSHPREVEHGLALMDGWVGDVIGRHGGPDPLFEVIAEGGPWHARGLEAMCAHLRATGREEHARWLEAHGGLPRGERGDGSGADMS